MFSVETKQKLNIRNYKMKIKPPCCMEQLLRHNTHSHDDRSLIDQYGYDEGVSHVNI